MVIVVNLKVSADNRIIDNIMKADISVKTGIGTVNFKIEDLLNTVYKARNAYEQARNNYIIKKSQSKRVGNAIQLALQMGASYAA